MSIYLKQNLTTGFLLVVLSLISINFPVKSKITKKHLTNQILRMNINSLKNKLDLLYELDDKDINEITQYAQENAQEQNLESISQRVLAIAQN